MQNDESTNEKVEDNKKHCSYEEQCSKMDISFECRKCGFFEWNCDCITQELVCIYCINSRNENYPVLTINRKPFIFMIKRQRKQKNNRMLYQSIHFDE